MATRVTKEMNWDEYCASTLCEPRAKLSTYTKGADWKLPAPYTRKTNKREAAILAEVKGILERNKIWYQRIDVSGKLIAGGTMIQSPMAGMPDIIALVAGKFYALELKASGGTVSSVQMCKLKQIQAAGGTCAVVVDPTHLFAWMMQQWPNTSEINEVPVL